MFAPRSAAGYGSFHTSPQPAGRASSSGSSSHSARMGGKYNAPMALLSGKKILVTGVISNRSIAYGIAKAARREGADIALTYQNERFKDRVTEMARELGSGLALQCDVSNDAEIAELFGSLKA